ncbi:MAG: NAD(P)/FAD-dependent oxidoreductase [Candidatus Kapaibacterium sp.]
MKRTTTFDSTTYDAIVMGGGPHGISYAHWLTEHRPGSRVAVVERNSTPGFKIGESTLSSATRSLIATGLSMPILRRLFGNKAGIRFWWTGAETDELHRHLDIVDIEETFQVERRVLEIALQEVIRRRPGVELITGVKVDLQKSDIEQSMKQIVCRTAEGEERRMQAPMICDATGPAAILARSKKLLRKEPERNNTFTTNSYYAYFRQTGTPDIRFWNEPATRHICFPGGWTWFITLTSWEKTSDENLRQMIRFLLDHPEGPDESYPSREELCRQFNCVNEQMTSIGFVVRDDKDETKGMNAEESFKRYVEKHPGLASVMENYELIEDPYTGRPSYGSFHNLVRDSKQVAGDGWAIVGDAGIFVNPIFSPGMNLGSGTSYFAAQATAEGLSKGDLSRATFSQYEEYVHQVYDALINETDLYYRSFEHPDSFEWGVMLKLVFGAADVVQRSMVYSEEDLYAHDLLNPEFRSIVDRARSRMRRGEEVGELPEEVAADVKGIIHPFIRQTLAKPEVRRLRLASLFNQYNGRGERVEKKYRRRRAFGVRKCQQCSLWSDRSLKQCPVCHTTPSPKSMS